MRLFDKIKKTTGPTPGGGGMTMDLEDIRDQAPDSDQAISDIDRAILNADLTRQAEQFQREQQERPKSGCGCWR